MQRSDCVVCLNLFISVLWNFGFVDERVSLIIDHQERRLCICAHMITMTTTAKDDGNETKSTELAYCRTKAANV